MQNTKLFLLYHFLRKKYGRLIWWTHEKPFEIMIGAILVQNTNWKNAEKAINNLKTHNVFRADKIINLSITQLIELIKPAGLYNQKAPRIKLICHWYKNEEHFQLLKRKRTTTLRNELLAMKGIGNETADAILLYGFKRCAFVIDSYCQKLLIANGIIKKRMPYCKLQLYFHQSLPKNQIIYSQFHALIVHHSQMLKSHSDNVKSVE